MLRSSRVKWLAAGVGALAVVVATLAYTSSRSMSQGRIVFEMAPYQLGSPLTMVSIVLRAEGLTAPAMVLRNQSARAVRGVSAMALIRTPTSRRSVGASALVLPIPAGAQATSTPAFSDLWRADPWSEFPTGAVVTFGLESVTFVDGSEWKATHAPDGGFILPEDVQLGPPVVIGQLPPWQVIRGRSITLANTVSQFPISGSMDGGACIMRACPPKSGGCEYNGCTIR